AIVLLAFFVLKRRAVGAAVLAWLLGTAVSLLFVNYPNVFPGVQAFNQPLIDLLHGADVSGLVSMVVAAGVYTGLVRARSQ
ncbi:MAG: hypothetical protein J2P45_30140, partial [Candidatus Dormibacteraeota bacterium]|nr:hypothetical protein [Candidatus Dormibacteraeota bacterium]